MGDSKAEREPILEVTDLVKIFGIKKGFGLKVKDRVVAVNHSSLTIRKGEIFGLVGESGCGKSTMGRCILQLIKPTSGSVKYKGQELLGLSAREMKQYRQKMQIVFQNPYASLNPRLRIRSTLLEVLKEFHLYPGQEETRILEVLQMVGIGKEALYKFPHQFSGGQLQRIAIARALLVGPELIIADEPVSALDVSIQAQVINLLLDLKEKMGLTILFISHDLSVVEYICDRVAVIYNGDIVEEAEVGELFREPGHPYTRALISAVPQPDPTVKENEILLESDIQDLADGEKNCTFYSRCYMRNGQCETVEKGINYGSAGHFCKCIAYRETHSS